MSEAQVTIITRLIDLNSREDNYPIGIYKKDAKFILDFIQRAEERGFAESSNCVNMVSFRKGLLRGAEIAEKVETMEAKCDWEDSDDIADGVQDLIAAAIRKEAGGGRVKGKPRGKYNKPKGTNETTKTINRTT